MRKIKYALLLFIAFAPAVFAGDAKPSEQSIKELLTVTDSRRMVDSALNQVDALMQNAMPKALEGRPVTPAQQKIIDQTRDKTTALLRKELSWSELEPVYIRIYRDSFTQDELNDILAFYKTPSGQALIRKMPVVMQSSMKEMQQKMSALMPKLQQIQQEMAAQLKATAGK